MNTIKWGRLAGHLVASLIVVCAAALLIAGSVRLFVSLWP